MSERTVDAVISYRQHPRVNPRAYAGALVPDNVIALYVLDVLEPAEMRLVATDIPLPGWRVGATVALVAEISGRRTPGRVRGRVTVATGETAGDVPNVPVIYYRCVGVRTSST